MPARRETFLGLSPPDIGQAEIDAVVETLRSGWLTTGPRVKEFEDAFASFVGAPSIAVNSCTAALHCALLALGIGEGDAVVLPAMTFASGAHVIEHVGARPLIADVEPDTLCIDPAVVDAILAREPRVKAIMPVHLYGHPADVAAIDELADRYGVAVIEDAAHALPATTPEGTLIGSRTRTKGGQPVLTAFSFYATKNLATGEGGMLTGDGDLIEDARVWATNGIGRDAWKRYSAKGSWFYEVTRAGFKYNLSDVHAALGVVQLRRLAAMHARRTEIAARYDAAFADLPGVTLPGRRSGAVHAWHLYPLRLDPAVHDRDSFIEGLRDRNIGASVHFIPLHHHPYYRDRGAEAPVASEAYRGLVSLPLSSSMADRDVEDVIDAMHVLLPA